MRHTSQAVGEGGDLCAWPSCGRLKLEATRSGAAGAGIVGTETSLRASSKDAGEPLVPMRAHGKAPVKASGCPAHRILSRLFLT